MREPELVVEDGYLVDPETGEVRDVLPPSGEFRLDSLEAAEWVLRKILEAEAEVRAVENRPEVVVARAVVANAERIANEKRRRLEFLKSRFEPELAELAARLTEGGRSRTVKTPFGSFGLTRVAGKLQERDRGSERTVEAMERFFNGAAIQTERKFRLSDLTGDERALIEQVLLVSAALRANARREELRPLLASEDETIQVLAADELRRLAPMQSERELAVQYPLGYSLWERVRDGNEEAGSKWAAILGAFEMPEDRDRLNVKSGIG